MSTTALTVAFIVMALLLIGLALAVVLLYRQLSDLRFDSPTASKVAEALCDGRDQDALRQLLEYFEAEHARVSGLADHAREVDSSIADLRRRARGHLQRMALVRFDASEEVSGRLSCAMCVLDAASNGFLVTTLYDLERSRTFVREIKQGRPDRELLEAERRAIEMAAEAEDVVGDADA